MGDYFAASTRYDRRRGPRPWAENRRHRWFGPELPLATLNGAIDRHGIFTKLASERLTLEEGLTGTRLPTQIGRALEELDLERI